MFPLIFGIVSGALSALSSFSGSMQAGANQRQQAAQMRANAEITRRNADIERERGRQEAYEQDRQKIRLRREFNDKQAANRLALGAGYVDMTSGSALDQSLGNIDAFASDMADNKYAVAMRKWESREKEKGLRAQADNLAANASYLDRTAANIGTSLLTAGLSGAGSFAGAYSIAGGSLPELFGFGGKAMAEEEMGDFVLDSINRAMALYK